MVTSKWITSGLLALGLAACGGESEDAGRLAAYRAAIPSESRLSAAEPDDGSTRALNDRAEYPGHARGLILGVNGSVRGIVRLMKAITDLPPSFFNSETKEYVWGPWDNEDEGGGKVAAYIKEEAEGADFKYSYALLRGVGNDLATFVPVIWGGATPDPDDEDRGVGVTMWDFEANHTFAEAHDPLYSENAFDRGRFVVLYGAERAEDDNGEFAYVVAVFRNFIAKDSPNDLPGDLDYFYGKYMADNGTNIDFVDVAAQTDISNPLDGTAEDLHLRLAFLDMSTGRAEASASGGAIDAGVTYSATECWGPTVRRTFFEGVVTDAANQSSIVASEGTEAACGDVFQNSLDELGIPSLDDVDPALLTAMGDVAETGILP